MGELKDIWVYINKRGHVIEVPACIPKRYNNKWMYALTAFDRDNYTFVQEVAKEPGMIFNNSVWFKKKNFKKAKDIFMADYGQKSQDLWAEYEKIRSEMALLDKQEEVE